MPDLHFQGSIQDGPLIVPKPNLLAICVEYRRPNMVSVTEEGSIPCFGASVAGMPPSASDAECCFNEG